MRSNMYAEEYMSNKIIVGNKDYTQFVDKAVRTFWKTKKKQLTASGDSTNRGAVVGGKQMDDFINLFRNQKISRTNYLELLLGEFLADPVENKNEMSGIE